MVEFVNMTPHTIALNDGRAFRPSGRTVRIEQKYLETRSPDIQFVECSLPEPPERIDNVFYIVSAMVLSAFPDRSDFVAPATGHPDCVRDDAGRILSVPFFIR